MRWLLTFTLALLALCSTAVRAGTPNVTVQLRLGMQLVEGRALTWSNEYVRLLGRDGRLWEFNPKSATDVRKSAPGFRAYSVGEFREQLLREFGPLFDISPTGHYLVVHPKGQRSLWGERFEDLYRSFVHYFNARGLKPREPKFPMVALVFHKQADFMRYAERDGQYPSSSLLGYYSPSTNRVALYDITAGAGGNDWQTNADTVIHEATHQTAFNTGIHNRFALTPRWLAEGLGTLFEAPGVWNSRFKTARIDRVNRGRMESFRRYMKHRPAGALAQMISHDLKFQSNVDEAYAEAWAFTYYLVETQAKKFGDYLAKTAARGDFIEYSAADRTSDFVAVFGDRWPILESHFLQFMAAVP